MTKIRLHIFDPPSLDKNILDSMCRETHGAIIVFDLSNKNSFYDEKFRQIFNYIQNNTDAKIILLGNKSDIVELEKSEISLTDINKLMQDFNISDLKITSAKLNINIENTFSNLVELIIKSKYNELIELEKLGASIILKIVILGLKGVGKTSIKNRYLEKTFEFGLIPTTGLDSETKIIDYEFKQVEEKKKELEEPEEDMLFFQKSEHIIDKIDDDRDTGAFIFEKEKHIEEDKIEKEDVFGASEYDETTIEEKEFEDKRIPAQKDLISEILKEEITKKEDLLLDKKIKLSEDIKGYEPSKIEDSFQVEEKKPEISDKTIPETSEAQQDLEKAIKSSIARKMEESPKVIPSSTPKAPPPPATGASGVVRGVQVPTTPPKAPAPPPPSSSSLPGRAAGLPPSPPEEEKQTFTERMESPSPMITQKPVPMKKEIDISGKKHKKEKKMKPSSKKKSAPSEIVSREKQRKKGKELGEISDFEMEEEASEELYDYAADEGKGSDRSILTEPTTILRKKLIRKATVFYKKRMNPMKLNKMTVFLSTSEIFEELKLEFEKIARAATGKALEIEEDESIVRIEPSFPGCVCVPTVGYLDAKKEYDHLNFIVSPLSTGEIPEAKVNIYYKDKLIDTIATPAKVVNTNIAKISAVVTLIIPLIGTIFDEFFSQLFGDILPFYSSIGGLEGILTILTTFMLIISGISYYLRKPKDAKPAESKSLSEIVSSISE